MPQDTADGARRRRSNVWLRLLLLSGLIALGAAAATFVWQDSNPGWPQANFVTSSGFRISSTSDPVWREASTTMTAEPRVIDPAAFRIHAGDSVEVDYPFQIVIPSDTRTGTVRVNWAADTRVPDAVFGLYSIHDAQGRELTGSMTTLGSETSVEFPPTDDGATGYYTVRIYLDFAGLDARFGTSSLDQLDDLGDFTVELS